MENETGDLAPDTLHLYQFLTPRIFFPFLGGWDGKLQFKFGSFQSFF